MSYGIKLESISIEEYKRLLKKQNLLPSRRLLLNDIDKHFATFNRFGVSSVKQLLKLLSDKKMAEVLAMASISQEYIVILKREIGALIAKPVPLSSFINVNYEELTRLNARGIVTTKDYFDHGKTSEQDVWFSLSDLVRINGVGPVAATIFLEAGYHDVASVAKADALVLLEQVNRINEEKGYYKGKLGEKDMRFCIDFAQLLIKYAK